MQRKILSVGLLAVCTLATVIACSGNVQTPLAPTSAVAIDSSALNADGSSLKVTAPNGLTPDGATVETLKPSLSFNSVQTRFPAVASFAYQIEIVTEGGNVVYSGRSTNGTSHELETDLEYATNYQWRARAMIGNDFGPWSASATFRTLDRPVGTRGAGTAGPRAADPPPGQLLAVPDYAAGVVMEMAARHGGELARACKDNHDWLFLLVQELRSKYDTRWGLNFKRGDPGQGMSTDIISYNPTDQPDDGNGRVYIFDVIGAECEQNRPGFNDVTGATWVNRGNSLCGAGTWCTMWTIDPYLRAGYTP
jgi:hypothetical protein